MYHYDPKTALEELNEDATLAESGACAGYDFAQEADSGQVTGS